MLIFSTDMFHYDKEDTIFTQEASSLGLPAREWNSLRRVPVETKIKLQNNKSGEMVFDWYHSDMDAENEVHGWNYKSKNGIQVLIIND